MTEQNEAFWEQFLFKRSNLFNTFIAAHQDRVAFGDFQKMHSLLQKYGQDVDLHLVDKAEDESEKIVRLGGESEEESYKAFARVMVAARDNERQLNIFFKQLARITDHKVSSYVSQIHKKLHPILIKELHGLQDASELAKAIEHAAAASERDEVKSRIRTLGTELNIFTRLRIRGQMRLIRRDPDQVEGVCTRIISGIGDIVRIGETNLDINKEIDSLSRIIDDFNQAVLFFYRLDLIIMILILKDVSDEETEDVEFAHRHYMPAKETADIREKLDHVKWHIADHASNIQKGLNLEQKKVSDLQHGI